MLLGVDKGQVRQLPWFILRYSSDIRLEEWRETTLTRCVPQVMSGLQTGPLLPTARPQPNVTGGWFPSGGVATTTVTRCRYPDYNYDIATAVICGMYLVFGVVYSLFGK
jgi:hypothetical protein